MAPFHVERSSGSYRMILMFLVWSWQTTQLPPSREILSLRVTGSCRWTDVDLDADSMDALLSWCPRPDVPGDFSIPPASVPAPLGMATWQPLDLLSSTHSLEPALGFARRRESKCPHGSLPSLLGHVWPHHLFSPFLSPYRGCLRRLQMFLL